jgi:hypothetical protein
MCANMDYRRMPGGSAESEAAQQEALRNAPVRTAAGECKDEGQGLSLFVCEQGAQPTTPAVPALACLCLQAWPWTCTPTRACVHSRLTAHHQASSAWWVLFALSVCSQCSSKFSKHAALEAQRLRCVTSAAVTARADSCTRTASCPPHPVLPVQSAPQARVRLSRIRAGEKQHSGYRGHIVAGLARASATLGVA